ncbi:MAG: hypothetical protein ACSLFO_01185 [Acidimicrobiales bacterium]
MTPTAAQQLAEAVVRDGFGSHRAALAALFARARRRGVTPVLVAVAADPTAPVPVRERALGRAVVEYCRILERAGQGAFEDPVEPLTRQLCSTSAA